MKTSAHSVPEVEKARLGDDGTLRVQGLAYVGAPGAGRFLRIREWSAVISLEGRVVREQLGATRD